jgi:hypothetical protein
MRIEFDANGGLPLRTVIVGLGLVSLLVNFTLQSRSAHVVQFSSEASNVALALLHGRGFADPFLTGPSGPTALTAPVYPFLYAALCWIFGTAWLGWAAIVAVTALAWALQWACAYRFAHVCGFARAGLGAALFGVFLPLPGRLYKWEAVFTGLTLAWSALLFSRIMQGDTRSRTSAQWGIALAASVLLCPSAVLILPFWGGLLLYRLGLTRSLQVVRVALLVAFLPIAGWTARNYAVFHHVFFVRDAAGIVLDSSNNDCTTGILSSDLASGCIARHNPSGSIAVLDRLRAQGEYDYSAAAMQTMVAWTRAHPARFAVLTAKRTLFYWFPIDRVDFPSTINGMVFSLFTLLSLLGLQWARSDGFRILITMLLPYSLVYYFAQVEQRYRYPVFWISVLLALIGLELLLRRRGQTREISCFPHLANLRRVDAVEENELFSRNHPDAHGLREYVRRIVV